MHSSAPRPTHPGQGNIRRPIKDQTHERNAGTGKVSGNIVEVNRAAGETKEAALHLQLSADGLTEQGEVVRTQVEKFLASVRSA